MSILSIITGCSVKSVPTAFIQGKTIQLTAPAENGVTLLEALKARHSVREYATTPLTLDQLSGLMWASSGINRENGKRTAPSALALYSINVYAFLSEGVYLYDATNNTLNMVAEGNHMPLTGLQGFVETAPLNIVYVANLTVYDKSALASRSKGKFYSAQDAAHYAENVNLWAAAHGLGAVTRGSFQENRLLKLLGLDSKDFCVVLAQTVGQPAE